MTTHSSILAWRIPWTGEPGRLQSMGSQRVGHDLAHTHVASEPCPSWSFPGRGGAVLNSCVGGYSHYPLKVIAF